MNMRVEWPNTIERDASFTKWLESVVFRGDEFDAQAFATSHTLYHVELQDTLLEDAVHLGVPAAGFTKLQLNDAIRRSSIECCGHDDTKWFHVNIHDGIVRVVEKFGRYDYDYPLVPLYIFLNYHHADEGGPTYAGLASAKKEWLLLFDCGLDISVHGGRNFVDSVVSQLNVIKDA